MPLKRFKHIEQISRRNNKSFQHIGLPSDAVRKDNKKMRGTRQREPISLSKALVYKIQQTPANIHSGGSEIESRGNNNVRA